MAKILIHVQEEGGEDYEDEAVEWKAKTVNNALADFKVFFINHDNIVRGRDNHKRTKARDSGFHSANSAKEIKERLAEKLETALAAFAQATYDTINQVMAKPTDGEKSSVLEAIKELTKEVTALKKKSIQKPHGDKGSGSGGDGGGGGGVSGGGGDASGGGGNKKNCM